MSAYSGKIFGTITDAETGEPLIGAVVRVHRRDGLYLGSAGTNLRGEWLFLADNQPEDVLQFKAEYLGYVSMETLEIIGQDDPLNFKLMTFGR
ncbi:MAG TPA: hypothetical protein PK916_08805 [Bacteroidota bacterium]|nr:hypothetical protein [Bacteroidota bacterium]